MADQLITNHDDTSFIMRRTECMGKLMVLVSMMLCATAEMQAQSIFRTNKGSISFKSEAPLEIITASSNSLEGIIDNEEQTFAFVVPILSFKGFNNGLQQQHFYENYLEAAKYPEATFTGKIIEEIDLTKPGTYQARAKGQFKIHGRTKERIIRIDLTSDGTVVIAKAQFLVPLVDHQIEVPRIVNQKIAEEILVIVRATLTVSGRS